MNTRTGAYRMKKIVDGLTPIDWTMIHFKVALGLVWPIAFSNASPEAITRNLGYVFLAFWMTSSGVGMIVSLTGLVMSAQTGLTRLRGFRIEVIGLWIFMAGPLVYFAAQVGILIQEFSAERVAQIAVAYALACAVFFRILLVNRGAKKALGVVGER